MTDTGAIEAVERILNRGGDADDVLRDVLAVLVERGATDWAGIAVNEDASLVLGPSVGIDRPAEFETRPIALGGRDVGELWTAPGGDAAVLDRVAVIVSPYVPLDTGGAR